MLHCYVHLHGVSQSVVYLSLVCNVCIVAERCVLEQKLLLTAQLHKGSRMWGIDWCQWPWTLFTGCLRSRRPNASHSSLNMAKNVRDIGLVPKDYQSKMAYAESNIHVTDNVAWSQNVKLVTTIRLEPNISDGLFSTPLPCLTARSWEPSEFLDETYEAKTRGIVCWKLHNPNFSHFDWSTRVTDRQTDRPMDGWW